MAQLVTDCPRCGASHITFDIIAATTVRVEYNWKHWYETFGVCRKCKKATILVLADHVDADYEHVHDVGLIKVENALNNYVEIKGHISLKDKSTVIPPEFLPAEINAIFLEGSTCFAVGCYNAAGTMFRLCLDFATKSMLPSDEQPGLTSKVRRDLGLRLPWLFDNGHLPKSVQELSSCVKEDGNDGAHAGTLTENDASDLMDFAKILLERLYTEPARLRLAKERRDDRRKPAR